MTPHLRQACSARTPRLRGPIASVVGLFALGWAAAGCGQLLGLDEDRSLIVPDPGDNNATVCACDDANPCTEDVCVDAGCVHRTVLTGFAPEQVDGDCQRVVCEDGVASSVAYDVDHPPREACRSWSCVAGAPLSALTSRGESCDPGDVGVCDGAGSCVECLDDRDCGGGVDTCGGAGTPGSCGCTPLSCDDLQLSCGSVFNGCHGTVVCDNDVLDGDETDIDCGGAVSACHTRCSSGQRCALPTDCDSGFCGGGRCSDPWGDTVGGSSGARVNAIATEVAGEAVVVGDFTGSVTLAGTLLSTETSAGFVVKFGTDGGPLFGLALADHTSARDVAIDAADNIVVVGSLDGIPRVEKRDGVGKPLWTVPIAMNGTGSASAVAIDASGHVFVVGDLDGALMIGNTLLTGSDDVFLLELDTSGAVISARTFPSVGSQRAVDVAVGPLGRLAIAADFVGTVDLDGAVLTSGGDWDAYVSVLDAEKDVVATTLFSGPSAQHVAGVAYDGMAQLFVAGSFFGVMHIDDVNGAIGVTSAGSSDIFVARLGTTDLAPVWVQRYGDAQQQSVAGVASDARGGVTIAGSFNGVLDLGGSALVSAGGMDAFFASFDEFGGVQRSQRFGDGQAQYVSAVAMSPFGAVFLAGSYRGTLDFGQGPIPTATAEAAFAAAL